MMLVNTSGVGRISPFSATAIISVSANDYPYGLFSFSSKPLLVSESVGEVNVTITREFGATGTVAVDYMTLSLPVADK